MNEWANKWMRSCMAPSLYRWENKRCKQMKSVVWTWTEPGLEASFSLGLDHQPSLEGGLPTGRAVCGSCFSETGLIFTCSREHMWHVILSRLRGILRRKQGSFGSGPFRSGQSDGKLVIRSWWLKAHTLQPESESWLCPLLVVRLWVDHFTLYLTHKIYFKGLEWGLHELMYVLRIVPGRLVLYMCEYYYYEKFELIGKRGLGYIKITNYTHDINC